MPRAGYRIGVTARGVLTVLLSSDDVRFGGRTERFPRIYTKMETMHGKDHSFSLDLPGLSCVYLKYTKYKTKQKG